MSDPINGTYATVIAYDPASSIGGPAYLVHTDLGNGKPIIVNYDEGGTYLFTSSNTTVLPGGLEIGEETSLDSVFDEEDVAMLEEAVNEFLKLLAESRTLRQIDALEAEARAEALKTAAVHHAMFLAQND